MYDKLKKDLNLFTGELISEFIPFEKDKVIDFQTGLLSLSLSDVITSYSIHYTKLYDHIALRQKPCL